MATRAEVRKIQLAERDRLRIFLEKQMGAEEAKVTELMLANEPLMLAIQYHGGKAAALGEAWNFVKSGRVVKR